MFEFTEAHREQIKAILESQNNEALAMEHLFVLKGNKWSLLAVGTEDDVVAKTCKGAKAYLHTHPVPSYESLIPSALDMQVMASSNKPHGIMNYSQHGDAINPTFWHSSITPAHNQLEGRGYRWGEYGSDGRGDCYAIIRDWFRLNKGICLPSFPRDYHDAGALNYLNNFNTVGHIVPLEEMQEGDVIVLRIGSQGEHGGVYVGNGLWLHHPINGVSRIEPVSRFVPHLSYIIRVTYPVTETLA